MAKVNRNWLFVDIPELDQAVGIRHHKRLVGYYLCIRYRLISVVEFSIRILIKEQFYTDIRRIFVDQDRNP
jgi:hypothetical protein